MAKKRLFDPGDSTPFPLSRSKLALYLECPRCFWLDRRHGIARPPGFPLSLNLAVDVLMKKEFDRYRAEAKPHPAMATNIPGAVPANPPELQAWRNPFKGVRRLHVPSGFLLYGAIDDVWMLPNGELVIVDYKAAATSKTLSLEDESRAFYRRQLDVYHWIMSGLDVQLAPYAFILWANACKDRPGLDGRLDFAMSLSPYKPTHGWIEPALMSARACLMAASPPTPSSKCPHCGYRAVAHGAEHVVAAYPWGPAMPPKYGNYADQSSACKVTIPYYDDGFSFTCPVERSGKNDWGLYGVGGNVWEVTASDATGESFGAWCGASWRISTPGTLQCAFRFANDGAYDFYDHGFRLVLTGTAEAAAAGQAATNQMVSRGPSGTASAAAMVETILGSTRQTRGLRPSQKWTNSLGMQFAPVVGLEGVLFSIWETRVRDFREFATDLMGRQQYDYRQGRQAEVLKADGWKGRGWEYGWSNPGFQQEDNHPVVCVSYEDAKKFCEWLTKRERAKALIGTAQSYRLPFDWEWSVALGLKEARDGLPAEKHGKLSGYPWGEASSPPPRWGNYASEEHRGPDTPAGHLSFAGYHDGYARTSPVGTYGPKQGVLCDLGGNVWELCEDWFDVKQTRRVARGGGWNSFSPFVESSYRQNFRPDQRMDVLGFRVVLSSHSPSVPLQMPQDR